MLTKIKSGWAMLYKEMSPYIPMWFLIISVGTLFYSSSERHERQCNAVIAAKDKELADLRQNIKKYLMVDGTYDMKAVDALPILERFGLAKQVLPVMRDFGVQP